MTIIADTAGTDIADTAGVSIMDTIVAAGVAFWTFARQATRIIGGGIGT